MTIAQLHAALAEQIAKGNGDVQVLSGYDDDPEYLSEVYLADTDLVKARDGDEVQDALVLYYSNSGCLTLVEFEEEA